MTALALRQLPSRYDRIQRINDQIKHIEETIYPDDYEEIKKTMIKALEERIDAIVDGRC